MANAQAGITDNPLQELTSQAQLHWTHTQGLTKGELPPAATDYHGDASPGGYYGGRP